ncbi:MAG: hypothetical protein WC971_08810 [Coriobacteriia bacterium]
MTGSDPILISNERHGLPFSKGLTAQSFTATGLSPALAYAAAQAVEDALRAGAERQVSIERLRELSVEMLRVTAGDVFAQRYQRLAKLSRIDKPLIIMIGGTTGVGKSTIATEVAHRLGITRIVSTDSIRQVMRGIFSRELMPALHESAFNAWRGLRVPVPHGADPVVVGFREQTAVVGTGIVSLVERAALEGESLVVEGVHIVPGYIEPSGSIAACVVQLVITVDDEDAHRSHFYIREVQTDGMRPFERYRANFETIRLLGHYIDELAVEHHIPIIHSNQLDRTVAETLERVIDAAIGDETPPGESRKTKKEEGEA